MACSDTARLFDLVQYCWLKKSHDTTAWGSVKFTPLKKDLKKRHSYIMVRFPS